MEPELKRQGYIFRSTRVGLPDLAKNKNTKQNKTEQKLQNQPKKKKKTRDTQLNVISDK